MPSVDNWQIVPTLVFGTEQHGGNPGPVVLDCDGITENRMQSLAREIGAETAFVLRPTSNSAHVRLRFFTPERELGMCVHSTIAAITVLVSKGLLKEARGKATVECAVGSINTTWNETGGGLSVAVEQFAPTFDQPIEPHSQIARAIFDALRSDVVIADFATGPLQVASVSRSKLLLPIRSAADLDAIKPDWAQLWNVCERLGTTGVYVFTSRPRNSLESDIDARQFPLRAGFPEDPATGVAAAALGAYLYRLGRLADIQPRNGWRRLRVAQGHAMGHKSILDVEVLQEVGLELRTRVRGQATIIHEHQPLIAGHGASAAGIEEIGRATPRTH